MRRESNQQSLDALRPDVFSMGTVAAGEVGHDALFLLGRSRSMYEGGGIERIVGHAVGIVARIPDVVGNDAELIY